MILTPPTALLLFYHDHYLKQIYQKEDKDIVTTNLCPRSLQSF